MSAANFLAAISIHLYLYCSIKYIKQWGSVIVNNSPTSPLWFWPYSELPPVKYKNTCYLLLVKILLNLHLKPTFFFPYLLHPKTAFSPCFLQRLFLYRYFLMSLIINYKYSLIWIPHEDFSAYAVKDGEVHDIMDHEMGLISADELDSISDYIGSKFEKLLDLWTR